ncbi:hypothetical protein [Ellagibacter isourolithinifaciens]|jgi:hypothetical protein|uniref:hypothetical protein n=1 Tax=Ellagibacter isourolithinifaciens TaxID=2137581 RepID=UPI003A8FD942
MDRRTFVKLAAAAVIASTISGCTSANDETGANQMPMEDGLTSGGPMSCITFSTGEITDIDEDALTTTINLDGNQKYGGETIVVEYTGVCQVSPSSIRSAKIGQRVRAGYFDSKYKNGVFPGETLEFIN